MKINEIVREMNPPRYTTAQAAELVGRSEDTLRRWREGPDPIYVPSDYHEFGGLVVPLYTRDDISKMKKIAKTIKPGRKPASV